MRGIINEILGWVWNFALWGTIAYYVFERGQSGWWFLLAVVATASNATTKGCRNGSN